jgi:glycosyltransferase involved in cell wall biosynthesis
MSKKTASRSPLSKSDTRISPLVSIITVCFDAEATITETIESVLRQSYANIEYIIVDGGSTDGTVDIIRSYEARFGDRMRWTSAKDDGIYHAMQKGIDGAKGEVVGILNSDDWYEPHTVEDVVRSYRVNGSGVYYGILRVLREGKLEELKSVAPEYLFRDVVGHPAYFVSRDVYVTHGSFDLQYRFAADYDLMMRYHRMGIAFWSVEKILATYRQGGRSGQSGLNTLLEQLSIRRRYGYLTGLQYSLRTLKYKTLAFLKKFTIRL